MKKITNYLIVLLLAFWCLPKMQATTPIFINKIEYKITISTTEQEPDTISKEKKSKTKHVKTKKTQKKKVSFETFEYNYERALHYYENKQFLSAAKIFEELYPLSLGSDRADTILFLFADCYFQNRDYEMAAYHFKDYARRFPRSDRAELAHLMAVKAIYNVSPYYALDQMETHYAIEELNLFISLYPNSEYMGECNQMLDVLRNKLAKKDFELIKLYFNTENYQASQIAIRNFLKTYSYTPYAAEAAFILVKNNYQFAKKSVEKRKLERYSDCVEAFQNLNINFPASTWINEGKKLANEATKQIEKLKNKKDI